MDHYRLAGIQDRAYWQPLADSTLAKGMIETLGKVPARLPLPTAADFLAARRNNDRSPLDHHWRGIRPLFSRLVLNRLLQGMGEDDRLLNWVFDYTFEPCWVVSAHLPDNDLPAAGRRQMDLAGCEMAAELAEAREMLLPWLREQSGTLADSIVHEIDRRCLIPLVNEVPEWWADTNNSNVNNWTGVCGGSLLAACLSLEVQGLPRPEARQKAADQVNRFFAEAFTATGECDEGPVYWHYGMEYACLPLSRMSREEVEATFDAARIRQVAGYLERAHLCGNRFFAGNDSVAFLNAAVGVMAWLAEFADSSFLRWWVGNYPGTPGRTVGTLVRDAVASSVAASWHAQTPSHKSARLLDDQQVGIFQRPSPRGLFTFTLSGGYNGESHNHNDLGTFQVLLDDKAWIPDLGSPEYKADFFDDRVRYTKYLIAASGGHCCPAINGYEQRTGKDACGTLLAWAPEQGHLALDLTAAYPAEAGLTHWVREAHVPQGQAAAVLRDTFELQRDGTVIHRIWFAEKPQMQGQTITCGPVVAHLSQAPADVVVQEYRGDDPRLMVREYPADHLLYRVDCTYRLPAGKRLELETRLSLA